MRNFITGVFHGILTVFILFSIIVGFAWLFDSKPENLYSVWKFLGNCLIISLLFFILFGGRKN